MHVVVDCQPWSSKSTYTLRARDRRLTGSIDLLGYGTNEATASPPIGMGSNGAAHPGKVTGALSETSDPQAWLEVDGTALQGTAHGAGLDRNRYRDVFVV